LGGNELLEDSPTTLHFLIFAQIVCNFHLGMAGQLPLPLTRKSSTPWDRLKPVKQDPLESMGFVSKGDTR
jgi:hypothetical protein